MTSEEGLFQKHRGRRVLLNSNLLLFYMIGTFQRGLVSSFKRTASYTLAELDTLIVLVAQFRQVVTTPHLLTEVNSLANSLPERLRADWHKHFADISSQFSETLRRSSDIMRLPTFSRFGLADAALHDAAHEALVVTDDFRLSGYLRSQGMDVLNFRQFGDGFKA